MNRLDTKKQAQIIAALVEGNSIRATSRMTGAAKNTVIKLLVDVGTACSEYQDKAFKNLPCTKIQCERKVETECGTGLGIAGLMVFGSLYQKDALLLF